MNKPLAYFNNFFWLFSTYFLSPFFYFLIFLRKKKNRELRILVIQGAKIGDLVCTTPVFREIKKKFPSSYLAALIISKTEGILRNNPHLDEIMVFGDFAGTAGKIKLIRKLRKEKYDWVFNVLPDSFNNIIAFWSLVPNRVTTIYKGAGEIITLASIFNNYRLEYRRNTSVLRHYLNLLRFISIKEYSEEKEIFIQPAEEKKALDFLKTQNFKSSDLLIGISVATAIKLKDWGSVKFAQLADQLVEKLKAKVIFIGSVDDYPRAERVQRMMRNDTVNSCGIFKLHELPALLKELKLFISLDTGPLYIADAVGIPVIDIVGPHNIREQAPSGDKCKIVQKNIYCWPCSYVFLGARVCKEGHLKCLTEVTVEEVFKAAQDIIN